MESLLLQGDEQSLSPPGCLSCFVARHRRIWCWERTSSAAALARRIWLLNLLKVALEKMGSSKCGPRAHVDELCD